MIQVQAEFIKIPHVTYTRLMVKPRTSANDTSLRYQCTKLIAAKKDGILETMGASVVPGYNTTAKSVAEYIYHIKNINWGAEKIDGAAGQVEMTHFYSLSDKTGTPRITGQSTMVVALLQKDDKGITTPYRKVIVFLRAEVLTVGQ